METLEELSRRFSDFSETSAGSRVPLYRAIATAVADDHEVLDIQIGRAHV